MKLPSFDRRPRLTPRRVVNVLALVLVAAFVLPFVVHSVPALAGAEGSYVVLSGSMEPAISPGDVVLVYDVDPATIAPGTVITYARSTTQVPTTHRVTSIIDDENGLAFRTKGDANEEMDAAPVPAEQVVGVVPTLSLPVVGTFLVAIPKIGYVVEFVGTPTGFALLVALPIVLLVATEILGLARRYLPGRNRAEDGAGVDADAGVETGADAHAGVAAAESDDEAAFTLDATDLTLALVSLTLLGAYSVAIAYMLQTAWSVAIAVAAVGGVAFVAAIKFLGFGTVEAGDGAAPSPGGDGVSPATDGGREHADPTRVVAGSLPPELADRPRIEVDAVESLYDVAAATNRWVVVDDAEATAFLVDGDTVYACELPADGGLDAETTEFDGTDFEAEAAETTDSDAGAGETTDSDAGAAETADSDAEPVDATDVEEPEPTDGDGHDAGDPSDPELFAEPPSRSPADDRPRTGRFGTGMARRPEEKR